MKIVAFDPGGTTGMALVRIPAETYDTGQLTSLRSIWFFLNNELPDQVVYESFLYQRRDKVDLSPVEAIGVIKLWCDLNSIPVSAQTPAMGKKFWTDEKIKKIGGWREGMPHAMDALRHLLHHRVFMMKHTFILEGLRD